jgi:exosortase/archaeosortase family protein
MHSNKNKKVNHQQKADRASKLRMIWKSKRPILLFVGGFALLIAVFYAIWFSEWFNEDVNPKITSINAFLSSKLLNLLGQGNSTSGETIFSPAFSISVARGCDGVEAMAIFAAALLSFPIPWRKKIPGVFLGVFLLFLLNLIRIISLFLIGVYRPSLSDVMHTEVWQVVFILAAVALWAAWIYRSTKIKSHEIKADDS